MFLCHHCCLGIGILTDKELEFVGEWKTTALVGCFYAHVKAHFPRFLQEQELSNWFNAVNLSNIDYNNAPSFTLSHKTAVRIGLRQALKRKIRDEQFFFPFETYVERLNSTTVHLTY